MDAVDMKTMQDIKDYVRSLDTPENEVYQNNSLLIQSCFFKALEILEENAKSRQADVTRRFDGCTNCKNNINNLEAGLWCVSNCIAGSKYEAVQNDG